ncbi:hypothetical protein MMC11_003921 [Xylographa trunciseda]|nr:hypothetical protein [Xylographa trunciseda]
MSSGGSSWGRATTNTYANQSYNTGGTAQRQSGQSGTGLAPAMGRWALETPKERPWSTFNRRSDGQQQGGNDSHYNVAGKSKAGTGRL